MPSQFFNIILHIKPERGYEILMQNYAGWIWSGTDFAMNSAGMVLSETTISSIAYYNPNGLPICVRERAALQYTDNLNDFMCVMISQNTGGLANMWLIGDIKTGEIVTMELAVDSEGNTVVGLRGPTTDGFFGSCDYPLDPEIRERCVIIYKEYPYGSGDNRYQRWLQIAEEYQDKYLIEC